MKNIPIISKLWGKEYWLKNNRYCTKILHLNKGHQCSLHYHKDKDEIFFIHKGLVKMEVGKRSFRMHPGDFINILPGVRHRFYGIDDSVILESSTPHSESDSYRIEVSK